MGVTGGARFVERGGAESWRRWENGWGDSKGY